MKGLRSFKRARSGLSMPPLLGLLGLLGASLQGLLGLPLIGLPGLLGDDLLGRLADGLRLGSTPGPTMGWSSEGRENMASRWDWIFLSRRF